jgi:hypothetical protein
MRKLSSTMKWQHFALVKASSPFGILDNMRYDRACPFEEQDTSILERFLTGVGTYQECQFVVTKWSESKIPMWTFIRWRSGNCLDITPIESEQAFHAERALVKFPPSPAMDGGRIPGAPDEGDR